MTNSLIDLAAGELLQKFGAGDHKPGSGSAAAFQGMLSAQLLRTVINLTNSDKRSQNYRGWLPALLKIDGDIEKRIYPALVRLFEEDSAQFDKVIKLRQARERANDEVMRSELAAQALQELKPATAIPIEIAKLCVELADFATYVFDHGFRAARGDSGVALSGAVSAIQGCLSIVDLNRLSFDSGQWAKSIRVDSTQVSFDCRRLLAEAMVRLQSLKEQADRRESFYSDLNVFQSQIRAKSRLSNSNIEAIARELQISLWKNRGTIWKREVPNRPLAVLQSETALKLLGYDFQRSTTLGQHESAEGRFEVAGLIDRQRKKVSISEQFPVETQNFTAAHELGHALLHEQNVLHRDRSLDGSELSVVRDFQELQADKFATYFLMPSKLVRNSFRGVFRTEKFMIKEDTAFALNLNVDDLRAKCKNLRELARLLAACEFFDGTPFHSLSKQFGVSIEAMAIRLEELELVGL